MAVNFKGKNIVTTGVREVDDLLATLEVKLQRGALRKGTRAGAKIVANQAKAWVPHDEGVLEQTLTVRVANRVLDEVSGKVRKPKRGKEFGHMVTHRDTGDVDPFYAHFAEFGTVKWSGDSYIRPALLGSKSRVLSATRVAIKKQIKKIRAKA